MTNLTEGRRVRWMDGEAWRTGVILTYGEVFVVTKCGLREELHVILGDEVLVQHDDGGALEFIRYVRLTDQPTHAELETAK